jgi:hypothetical protein
MKKLSIVISLLALQPVFTCIAHSQVVSYQGCVVDADILALPQCAMESRDGHLYVAKPYLRLLFSGEKARLVGRVIPGGGWAYFNRRGMIVVQNVANFDNGPSPFHHGLVRVNSKGKWGLADLNGLLVVPLTYDGMFEYEEPNRGWKVCAGCRLVSQGEYGWFEGGDWYWLDRHGKVAGKAENPMTPKAPESK